MYKINEGVSMFRNFLILLVCAVSLNVQASNGIYIETDILNPIVLPVLDATSREVQDVRAGYQFEKFSFSLRYVEDQEVTVSGSSSNASVKINDKDEFSQLTLRVGYYFFEHWQFGIGLSHQEIGYTVNPSSESSVNGSESNVAGEIYASYINTLEKGLFYKCEFTLGYGPEIEIKESGNTYNVDQVAQPQNSSLSFIVGHKF